MQVSTVAPQLPTTTPAAPSVEPRLTAALEVTEAIRFAQSLAGGPMPSADSVRQAAAGAHAVADEIWAGGARHGDLYGPTYTSASVHAKAGAEALDAAADLIAAGNRSGDAFSALDRHSMLARTTLTEALANLQELRDLGV